MPDAQPGTRWEWLRALGLLVAAATFSVLNPGVLVAVPFILLVLFLPARRLRTLVVGALAVLLAFGGTAGGGLWYLERGWGLLLGGWFLALTLRWPRHRFLARGLGAVAGAFAVMALLFWVQPGYWSVVDWAVTDRMEEGMSAALEAFRYMRGAEGLSGAFEARAAEAMALQGTIFPALLGLASLASLGLAWWLWTRLSLGEKEGALAPLKEFRFDDQLVWVLILGLAVLVLASDALGRVGTNAVVFMAALYALRGAAVVLFLTGGVSVFGAVLFVVGILFLAPLLVTGAFIIGLGDTWLNLRARRRETSSR
mgnify:CR=1 FL=1